tara:strand:- start:4129 stop:4656 length:528 start_codon:yes stop_codon:yes gene_type:complete
MELLDSVKEFIFNYRRSLLYLAIFSIVAGLALYFGMQDIYNNKSENKTTDTSDTFKLYHVTWCPYSIKAKKVWDSVLKHNEVSFQLDDAGNIPNTSVGTKTIGVKTVRFSAKDETDVPQESLAIVDDKTIEAYPTIFFYNYDKKIHVEFNAKCTDKNLVNFINDMISDASFSTPV